MQSDQISYNGTITSFSASGIEWSRLLRTTHVYQSIHTQAHRPRHLKTHLEIAERAFRTLYGVSFGLDESSIRSDISTLLTKNHYPAQGACVVQLCLFPVALNNSASEAPCYLLEVSEQLLYPRYTVWHTRPCLGVFKEDSLYAGLPTSAAQQAGALANATAWQQKATLSVAENSAGVLTNINDEPLFVYLHHTLLTTPLSQGATDTVMRRLILLAAKKIGIPTRESHITCALLEEAEELFAGCPQGVISFGSLGQVEGLSKANQAGKLRYFNTVATRLIDAIQLIDV